MAEHAPGPAPVASSSAPATHSASGPHRSGLKLLAAMVLIPGVVAGVLALFAWPAANLEPRHLPVGVAGPDRLADTLVEQWEKEPDRFDVHRYGDEAEARAAIEEREVYGAMVVGPQGATVLAATAASPMVAQLLTQAVAAQTGTPSTGTPQTGTPQTGTPQTGSSEGDSGGPAGTASGGEGRSQGPPSAEPKFRVVDVVPTTPDDPRGVVLGVAILPLVLGGLATGVVLSHVSRPGWGQGLGLVATSALTGLAAAWIAQEWLGALAGDWWVNAGVLGLTVLAISSTVAGLGAAIGPAGLGLGAVLMMLVGNPFSGVTSAPELLPTWAGVTGQLLPPGAGGTLLRSTAFFDSAAAVRPGLVLVGWVLLGVAGGLIGIRRRRRAT